MSVPFAQAAPRRKENEQSVLSSLALASFDRVAARASVTSAGPTHSGGSVSGGGGGGGGSGGGGGGGVGGGAGAPP